MKAANVYWVYWISHSRDLPHDDGAPRLRRTPQLLNGWRLHSSSTAPPAWAWLFLHDLCSDHMTARKRHREEALPSEFHTLRTLVVQAHVARLVCRQVCLGGLTLCCWRGQRPGCGRRLSSRR